MILDTTQKRDPTSNQLSAHADKLNGTSPSALVPRISYNPNMPQVSDSKDRCILRTSNGAPIDTLTATMTAGSGSTAPIVLQDFTLLDHISHFDRERIAERVVHAKGAGAFGYFEVAPSNTFITSICMAKLFNQPGKRTPIAVRFSTVGGESGSADTARDPRGFAIKFYTEDGNWDLVGNNTPIFFLRDPILFPSFIHTQKRNPATHCKDPDMMWDFISLRPETIHQVSFLFSDRGTPDGYRHMNGYGSHTFKNVNSNGTPCYVKYHFKTDQGIRNLSSETANRLASEDPDYAIRDLYNAIANGDFPSWTMYVQCMTYEQASNVKFNPFDLTKVWSHQDFPLHEIGRIVLNRNPNNYFAEVEQIAFSPSHMVPGVEPSPDKMLQARLFSYPDTHKHRLGPNYQTIPVNAPLNVTDSFASNYQRDGPMQITTNGGGNPNYFPNSFHGPQPITAQELLVKTHKDTTTSGHIERVETGDDDNFTQCRNFYWNVLDKGARERLTDNIAQNLSCAQLFIRKRALSNFYQVDQEYGGKIESKIQQLLTMKKQQVNAAQNSTNNTAEPLNPPRIIPAKSKLMSEQTVSCPYRYSGKL